MRLQLPLIRIWATYFDYYSPSSWWLLGSSYMYILLSVVQANEGGGRRGGDMPCSLARPRRGFHVGHFSGAHVFQLSIERQRRSPGLPSSSRLSRRSQRAVMLSNQPRGPPRPYASQVTRLLILVRILRSVLLPISRFSPAASAILLWL